MTISGTNISYTRAALTCVPILGMGVAAINLRKDLQNGNQLADSLVSANQKYQVSADMLAKRKTLGERELVTMKAQWKLAGETIEIKNGLTGKVDCFKRSGLIKEIMLSANYLVSTIGLTCLVALGVFTGPAIYLAMALLSLTVATYVVVAIFNGRKNSVNKMSKLLKQIQPSLIDRTERQKLSRNESAQALDLHMAKKKPYQRPAAAYLDLVATSKKLKAN